MKKDMKVCFFTDKISINVMLLNDFVNLKLRLGQIFSSTEEMFGVFWVMIFK